jgi:uncharacterized protein (TIGR01777 family)
MKDILITGGTGMLGTRLTELLHERGYHVKYLSRNPDKSGSVPAFYWDINKQEMDPAALEKTGTIIHLAGAGVADKRWSPERKETILQSRTRSAALLLQMLKDHDHQVEAFISASGISYYGNTDDGLKTEDSAPTDDFLADVTKAWEDAADRIGEVVQRVVKFRIGVVLSDRGGALPELAKPVRYWVGAPLGNGKQPMSWIHIDDLMRMFIHAIENTDVKGVYNAVSPNPVSNREMTHAISDVLQKPMFIPAVPGFMLKLLVGEMAEMLLGGTRISPKKIEKTGFTFQYPELTPALRNLLT